MEQTEKRQDKSCFRYQPIRVWCSLPDAGNPTHVALVPQHTSDTTGALFIPVEVPARPDNAAARGLIAVCYKHLFGFQSPHSLVESFELQRLLGAEKLYLYGYTNVSAPVDRVLRHYERSGFLHVQEYRIQPHWVPGVWNDTSTYVGVHTYGHSITINDCVDRFGGLYKYVAILDHDEFIIHRKHGPSNYKQLIQEVLKKEQVPEHDVCAISFPWATFCMDPKEQFLRWKSSELVTQSHFSVSLSNSHVPKSVVRPENTNLSFIHFPLDCRHGRRVGVPSSTAWTAHYRHHEGGHGSKTCDERDYHLVNYRQPLQEAVTQVLEQVFLATIWKSNVSRL